MMKHRIKTKRGIRRVRKEFSELLQTIRSTDMEGESLQQQTMNERLKKFGGGDNERAIDKLKADTSIKVAESVHKIDFIEDLVQFRFELSYFSATN